MEDYKEEGYSISQSIVHELKEIHSREQLLARAPKIKPLFNELVNLMIAARDFKDSCSADQADCDKNIQTDGALLQEMKRIYQIEGARELMEKIQEDALNRLDAYEKQRLKRKATRSRLEKASPATLFLGK